MKNNIYIILPFILLQGLSGSLFGQKKIKGSIAERHFLDMEYALAAPYYDDLAKGAVKRAKKGRSADWESVRRAAVSNFESRHYKKASRWYAVLEDSGQATKADYLMDFRSLQYQGLYADAEKRLMQVKGVDSLKALVLGYLAELEYYKTLRKDSAEYTVEEMPFNKNNGDFGPAFYDKGLVYASNRTNSDLGRSYGWDRLYFLNAFYTEKKGDGYKKTAKMQRRTFKTGPHDGPVFFSADGKTAYITRNRTEKDVRKGDFVKLGLYVSERGDKNKWSTPVPFQYNDKSYSVGHAALSPDGNTLYFASDMLGGIGGVDLWKSKKELGGWGKPENLGKGINTEGDEMFPFVSPEGHLYFASTGYVGLGGLDLYEARVSKGAWGKPANMGYPLNTPYDDFGLIVEKGGKYGYFSSDRGDYVDRIYGVGIKRVVFLLEGTVKAENDTLDYVPLARVVVLNETSGDSLVLTADSLGRFSAPLSKESSYKIIPSKPDYGLLKTELVSTMGLTESQTILGDVKLAPKLPDSLTLVIALTDCKTKEITANTPIIITDELTGRKWDAKTDDKGLLSLGKVDVKVLATPSATGSIRHVYGIEASGEGYMPQSKRVVFEIPASEVAETIQLEEENIVRDACVSKIAKGDKFELKDIYYDYNKATLRPESMVQLDKAYDFLVKNPLINVQLASHTDSRGSDSYNLGLSQRRAQSCVDYLIKVKGLPASQIVAKGYGESQLLNHCGNGVTCTEEEHQANRRTEIRITGVVTKR